MSSLFCESEISWLLKHHYECSHEELAKRFNKEFRRNDIGEKQIHNWFRNHSGLVKDANPNAFTKEKIDWLRENVNRYNPQELTEELNKKFGTHHNRGSVRTIRKRYNIHPSTERVRQSRNEAHADSLGREMEWNGYILVKTKNIIARKTQRQNYEPRAKVVWEKENGKVPEGYYVIHIDGNKKNDNISNLRCISKRINAKLTARKWHSKNEITDCGIQQITLEDIVEEVNK